MAGRFGAQLVLDSSEDVPARIREHHDGRLAQRVLVCTPRGRDPPGLLVRGPWWLDSAFRPGRARDLHPGAPARTLER
jgi:hypothetical protein